MRILFVYDLENEEMWHDGLKAAIDLLENDARVSRLDRLNLQKSESYNEGSYDFVLGWGGFNSKVDNFLQRKHSLDPVRKGLCLGGYGSVSKSIKTYETIFYECEWARKWIEENHEDVPVLIHAFGVNDTIFFKNNRGKDKKVYDYLSVGSYSYWKRFPLLLKKQGLRMVVGQIQKNNLSESFDILYDLVSQGVIVSDAVHPETLAMLYRQSKVVYMPCLEIGGGERGLLEARACGTAVEIEPDNQKLKELLTCPIWDSKYYAGQLKKGIFNEKN